MSTVFSWKVEACNEGTMLKDYLMQEKHFSRRLLTIAKFHNGGLLVNDKKVTVRTMLQRGDIVTVTLPPEEKGDRMEPEHLPLTVCYEDEHVLVVNKQAHMAVMPSSDHPNGTLANALLYYYEQQGLSNTVHLVNRLDRDTSGAMLIAKDRFTHYLLSLQQKNHDIERQYIAIAEGKVQPERGTINKPIARKAGSIIERVVDPSGQSAITHYSVEKSYSDKTLLSLKLETGRTHQIRVHLASIGHPLVGDDLYGGTRKELDRQALHSATVSFFHPFTKEKIEVEAPLPSDLQAILNRSQR